MKERDYILISGIIFTVVAILHLLRSINSMPLVLGTFELPFWLSYIAVIVTGALAIWAFRLLNK